MRNSYLGYKKFFGLVALFCLFFSQYNFSFAQSSPQFIISWGSKSYVPSWYQGKIFPINNSLIGIGFEIIDGGRIANISSKKIRWYVNDKLVKNEKDGLGIKSLELNTSSYNGANINIRIVILGYDNKNNLNKSIEIPIVGPEVVIDNSNIDSRVDIGVNKFKAHPFFFNNDTDNFIVDWAINGQKYQINPTEHPDPWSLVLDIDKSFENAPMGFEIGVSIVVKKDILSQVELATKRIKLFVR